MTVDPVSLTAFLAPFLPFLLKGAETVAEEAGRVFGQEAWQAAKGLWSKLRPKVDEKPAVTDAAKAVANDPEDELARNALAFQLRELLAADLDLKAELEQLWRQTEPAIIAFAAERGIAIAGDAKGSTFVTGNHVDIRK